MPSGVTQFSLSRSPPVAVRAAARRHASMAGAAVGLGSGIGKVGSRVEPGVVDYRREPRVARYLAAGAEIAPSLEAALARLADTPVVFVIGGAALYAQALPFADELVLTEIDAEFDADTYFPRWHRAEFRQTSRDPQQGP